MGVRSMGQEKLALVTTRLCVKYFGLRADWCSREEKATDRFLDSLIQSENFGKNQGNGLNVERVYVNFERDRLLRYTEGRGIQLAIDAEESSVAQTVCLDLSDLQIYQTSDKLRTNGNINVSGSNKE